MTKISAETLTPTQREQVYRRNFLYFLTDGILFTVAMGIIGPTTLIPDFIRHLTKSEILIGFSSSIFDVGFTLPQLFIARYIVRSARKKWWFVGPNIPVRFMMVIFGIVTVILGKDRPALILIAFLICYGVAAFGDGLVGVPWADLIGTSLDDRWRARMFGLMTASGGLIMLLLSPVLGIVLSDSGIGFPNNYALLFGLAGVLFAISILPGVFIRELPGGKAVEKIPSLGEFLPGLGHVLRTDGPFRAIIITRLLTVLFMMAGPFYIGFATVQLGLSSTVAVPTLLAMQTIGNITGAIVYSWLGARNNLLYIRLALSCAMILPITALIASVVGPLPLYFGFFVSGAALSNLSFSYQNWVISYSNPDQRPIYAGLFNTISALISLISPFIAGTIAQTLGYEALFAFAIVMVICALFVAVRYVSSPHVLPEASISN